MSFFRKPTPLPVTQGGTGNVYNSYGYAIIGNGYSAYLELTPSTSGNVMTSNGTTWTSAPPASSGSGTVNSGTQYQLGYYATSGTAISGGTSIVTDASGNLAVSGKITAGLKLSTFNTADQQAIVANTTWSGSNPRLLVAITKSGVGSGGLGIDASNDVTVFYTAGTGRLTTKSTGVAVTGTLSVTTGASVGGATAGAGGLAFPATQVAVADANTLDDYEEGTWTPSLGGNATYDILTGTYIKIGKVVTVTGSIRPLSLGTGSTNTMTGLPFSTAGEGSCGIGFGDGWAVSVYSVWLYVNGTSLDVRGFTTPATSSPLVNLFQNGARIYFTATYVTS